MKKMEGRATICLLLVLVMLAGLIYFVVRLEVNGPEWSSYYANTHIFNNGTLIAGEVKDRDGMTLLKYDTDGAHYTGTEYERRAESVILGDVNYSIPTGVNMVFRPELINYNFVTGTEGIFGNKGGKVTLSIDKEVNETAYAALGNREGFVCVYNYVSGDIICLVSTPTVDPQDPNAAESAASGAYINKVFSSRFAPGSTFKVLTSLAAIEKLSGMSDWTFTCTGSHDLGGNKITCPYAHGTMDFEGALANSCNCAFGELAAELGSKTMKSYVKKTGLTSSYDINGIETAKGKFEFDSEPVNLGWAGIGQYNDQANPMSLLVFMGSIAGGGTSAEPSIIKGGSTGWVDLVDSSSARKLDNMLRNNVLSNYGDENFPGLELRAKSGSAETGDGNATNAWFLGYSGDYAFVVMVEHGGAGATVAGPIANTVLQKIMEEESN